MRWECIVFEWMWNNEILVKTIAKFVMYELCRKAAKRAMPPEERTSLVLVILLSRYGPPSVLDRFSAAINVFPEGTVRRDR